MHIDTTNDAINGCLPNPEPKQHVTDGGIKSPRTIVPEPHDLRPLIVAIDPGTSYMHMVSYYMDSKRTRTYHYDIKSDREVDMILKVRGCIEDFLKRINIEFLRIEFPNLNHADIVYENTLLTVGTPLVIVESQFTAGLKGVWASLISSFPSTWKVESISPTTVKAHFRQKIDREHPGESGRSARHSFNKRAALDYVNENHVLGSVYVDDHNEADCLLMIKYALDKKL